MSLPITNYLELDRKMQSNGRCSRLGEKCQLPGRMNPRISASDPRPVFAGCLFDMP
jgi:hypothetical protein